MTFQPSAQALRAKTQSARIFDGRQSQALLFAHSRQPYHLPKRRQRDLIETKPHWSVLTDDCLPKLFTKNQDEHGRKACATNSARTAHAGFLSI